MGDNPALTSACMVAFFTEITALRQGAAKKKPGNKSRPCILTKL